MSPKYHSELQSVTTTYRFIPVIMIIPRPMNCLTPYLRRISIKIKLQRLKIESGCSSAVLYLAETRF